jgi:formylmethanofuran dehydrogenase subunit A
VLRGGIIHDPLHGRDGVVDDLWIDGGTIVPPPAITAGFRIVDATGLVVMPGGVDLHSHIAGPKVNLGRRMTPSPSADGRSNVPTIRDTGALYAALGYTTVFDAAIATGASRLAHLELDELPILDKGIYLLAGDDRSVIDAADGGDDATLHRLVAHHGQQGNDGQTHC